MFIRLCFLFWYKWYWHGLGWEEGDKGRALAYSIRLVMREGWNACYGANDTA